MVPVNTSPLIQEYAVSRCLKLTVQKEEIQVYLFPFQLQESDKFRIRLICTIIAAARFVYQDQIYFIKY